MTGKKKKQLTISNFFSQSKNTNETLNTQKPLCENLVASYPQPLIKTNPIVKSRHCINISENEFKLAESSAQERINKKSVSKSQNTKPAWWVTPPRDSTTVLPGARKRNADPVPFPINAKKTNSVSWQGRVRPLSRPSGMASRANSQSSVSSNLLTDEQKDVLKMVERGESIFFTGAAGTGKSFLLKQIVHGLKRSRGESELAITATTGLAAYHIGGQTIHRWAGVRTGEGPVSAHVQYIRKTPNIRDNWLHCKVLVIDEVSMLDSQLLDKLEEIARLVRGRSQPFGGIQLVLTGDFFQLPPVSAAKNDNSLCFEAKCWSAVISQCVVLSKIFRQKDNRLIQMLNAMRVGNITTEMAAEFKKLERKVEYEDGLEPTELYPVRWQVDSANRTKMQALKGSTFMFQSLDSSNFDSSQKLLDQLICYKTLELKIGAQVLLIRNLNDQLINGRRGIIYTFMSELEWNNLGSFLMQNEDALNIYNAAINAAADHSVIRAETQELNFPNEDVRMRFEHALTSPIKQKLPIVDFRLGQIVPIERVDFTAVNGGKGAFSEITRNQIPLVPSWALSIHKAQGQTLDRLVVDLRHVFEAGQAYVAVSRATSYDRLELRGFSVDKVRVHPRVSQFYRDIQQN